MKRICIILGALLFVCIGNLTAQVSPDCGNAIPICNDTPINGGTNGYGVDDFNGAQNSGCLEETVTNVIESNSAWYRFKTGASGQLGFNIGINSSEDWDFALYKANDCSDLGEPIRCNFFDNQDEESYLGVGEDPTGIASNIQYEDWLEVTPGEEYYLLINNFSNSNSGFSIQFSGNIFVTNPLDALDCSIVSNLLGPPISVCEGTNVTLNANVSDALVYNWFEDTGAGFQPIIGENSSVLVVSDQAIYRVHVVRAGGDNIISDVYVGVSETPTSFPVSNAPACSSDEIFDLTTKDSEVLGSQDASDVAISYHNTLADANSGANVLPKLMPMPSNTKAIYIRVSSVDNSDCYDATQQFQLIRLETPVLDFPSEAFLCSEDDIVSIGAVVARPFHTYSWNTGETTSEIDVMQEGKYILTVTNTQNGVGCSNSKEITVSSSTAPVISTIEIEDLQDENKVTVVMQDEGEWEYRLDAGPFQSSPEFNDVLPGIHSIVVNDTRGCGSIIERIIVVGFPKFFTPNGDSMNDYWEVIGISTLDNTMVNIYDRYGKLVAQIIQDSQGWDGTLNGRPLPASDYWFRLTYTDINGELTEAKYVNNHFTLKR